MFSVSCDTLSISTIRFTALPCNSQQYLGHLGKSGSFHQVHLHETNHFTIILPSCLPNLFLHIIYHNLCNFLLVLVIATRRVPDRTLLTTNRSLAPISLLVLSEELNLLMNPVINWIVYQQHFSRPLRRASPCASAAFSENSTAFVKVLKSENLSLVCIL